MLNIHQGIFIGKKYADCKLHFTIYIYLIVLNKRSWKDLLTQRCSASGHSLGETACV